MRTLNPTSPELRGGPTPASGPAGAPQRDSGGGPAERGARRLRRCLKAFAVWMEDDFGRTAAQLHERSGRARGDDLASAAADESEHPLTVEELLWVMAIEELQATR